MILPSISIRVDCLSTGHAHQEQDVRIQHFNKTVTIEELHCLACFDRFYIGLTTHHWQPYTKLELLPWHAVSLYYGGVSLSRGKVTITSGLQSCHVTHIFAANWKLSSARYLGPSRIKYYWARDDRGKQQRVPHCQ